MAEQKAQTRGLIEGKPGESLFWHGMLVFNRPNELPELLRKVQGMDDHRLLAIVTALLVEDRVDRILSAFMPRYSVLEEVADYGLSMKIRVLQALNFVPPLITSAAHCLREIRNEFAHDLEKTNLSEIGPKTIGRLLGIRASAYQGKDPPGQGEKSLVEAFQNVSFFCILGLDHYKVNVQFLREHISQPSFIESLHEAATKASYAWLQEAMSRPPVSTERRGDSLIETYEGGLTRVVDLPPERKDSPAEPGPEV